MQYVIMHHHHHWMLIFPYVKTCKTSLKLQNTREMKNPTIRTLETMVEFRSFGASAKKMILNECGLLVSILEVGNMQLIKANVIYLKFRVEIFYSNSVVHKAHTVLCVSSSFNFRLIEFLNEIMHILIIWSP